MALLSPFNVLMRAALTGRPIAWGLRSTSLIWLPPTQESGINSAGRSPTTRVSNGCSPTWLPTCTRRGSSVTRRHGDTIGSRNTVQALPRWPSSRPLRWCVASLTAPCSYLVVPVTAKMSLSNASGVRFARSGFWKAPLKSCGTSWPATCCASRHTQRSQFLQTED